MKDLRNILILITVTFVIWLGFNVYLISTPNALPASITNQLRVLPQNIDTKFLQGLVSK